MVRTQVQLTEGQVISLKRLAQVRGCSVAALVRQGVDVVLRDAGGASLAELRARALAACGRFRSGRGDISERHDEYLADDLAREQPGDGTPGYSEGTAP